MRTRICGLCVYIIDINISYVYIYIYINIYEFVLSISDGIKLYIYVMFFQRKHCQGNWQRTKCVMNAPKQMHYYRFQRRRVQFSFVPLNV